MSAAGSELSGCMREDGTDRNHILFSDCCTFVEQAPVGRYASHLGTRLLSIFLICPPGSSLGARAV